MRKAAALLVTTAMVAGLGLVAAAPAGAGDKKQSKYCKALSKSKLDSGSIGDSTSEKGAAKMVKQLEKLEKAASGKTKAAIGEMIDAYEEVADGEDPKDAFANSDFIEAAATFGISTIKCIGTELPDITLPDITLPDITLPDFDLN